MAGTIESRLAELGIELPEAPAPVANYMPYVVAGNLVFISGQVTLWNGEINFVGKVGAELSVEQGYEAARMCGLNQIAQVRAACGGDLDRVKQVVRLGAFVNCVPDFTEHPNVVNGASDLMIEVFGDAGRCTRTNVGAPSLPLGFAVEIDGIFEIA
ncbi:MAG: RidA family protein [Gammaproteobacteria bacterium]|nr:RidA family protein [Gammaproteobacteria bacterium]